MVLQNHGLPIPQCLAHPPPLFSIQYHPSEIVVNGMTFPGPQRVLCHRVQFSAKHAERLVDLEVDGEGDGVDGLVTIYDLTVFVDENEV